VLRILAFPSFYQGDVGSLLDSYKRPPHEKHSPSEKWRAFALGMDVARNRVDGWPGTRGLVVRLLISFLILSFLVWKIVRDSFDIFYAILHVFYHRIIHCQVVLRRRARSH
jgi:hypothetical protein